MPPTLALFLTLGFIIFLFRRDFREKPNVTGAVWLPTIWMFIIASKPVSQWLAIFGINGLGGTSVAEGSSLDAFVFLGLITAGFYVLSKREIRLFEIVRNNRWLMFFIFYCFLAIFWSDYPLSSFKRWIKILGHPLMVLILFTEPDPEEALVRLMTRCAYVLFPVSILWMKYYPVLGRSSDEWGITTNTGIAGGKNELGAVCLLFGLILIWHLLQILRRKGKTFPWNKLVVPGGLLVLLGYCLRKAHSSTSTLSLLLGILTMLSLGRRWVNKRLIGMYVLTGIFILGLAQLTFDIYGNIVELTGHESTIEGRGHLWQVLLETNTNPIFGTGFESYWLGERLQSVWALITWHPTQAHNGYLETYLSLGVVGLSILLGLIFVTFWKCRQDLLRNFEWGRLTMSYLAVILAHNWTEAGFKGLSIVYLVFFVVALKYPPLTIGAVAPLVNVDGAAEEGDLIMANTSTREDRATPVANQVLVRW